MEAAHRTAAVTLMEDLGQVKEYSFFQLNSMLKRMCELRSDQEVDTALRYKALPSLAFPSSDIDSCHWRKTPDKDLVEMYVSFMGLFGPASPLPAYYTERVIQSKDPNHPSRDFMDLFNHRSINLLQSCWEKYRYYARYQAGGEDQFSRWLLSLAGIDVSRLRSNSHLKWHKLMPMIGLLAKNACTADLLQRVIKSYFQLEGVEIEPWVKRVIQVSTDQCNAMGETNSNMGMNLILGNEILDCSGKFAIHLHGLTPEQYERFLPVNDYFKELSELVKLLQKSPLDYELRLHPKQNQNQNATMKTIEQQQMGWSACLGESEAPQPATICVADYQIV